MDKIRSMIAKNGEEEFKECEGKAIIGKVNVLIVELEKRTDAVKRAIEGLRSLAGDKVMSGTRYDKVMNDLDTMELEKTGKCDDRCKEVRKFIKEVTGRTGVLGGHRDMVVYRDRPAVAAPGPDQQYFKDPNPVLQPPALM